MSAEEQSSQRGKQPGRRARAVLRWLRVAVLSVILFALALVLWSNLFGVPGPVAGWVAAELRRKNVNVEFARLKLRGVSHIVAENLSIAAATNDWPSLRAEQAELLIDFDRLRRGDIEVTGLRLNQATLLVPLHRPNEEPRYLAVSNIVSKIDLLPGDVIRVAQASAEALGAKARAGGELRNFSRFARASASPEGGKSWPRLKEQLREMTDLFEALEFAQTPVVSVQFFGNAADAADLRGTITAEAGAAKSRWGSLESLSLTSSVRPMGTNAAVAGAFSLRVAGFKTAWAEFGAAGIEAETIWSARMDELITNRVSLDAARILTRWGEAERLAGAVFSGPGPETNFLRSSLELSASELTSEGRTFGASKFGAEIVHALPIPSPAAWFRKLVEATGENPASNRITGDWRFESSGIIFPRSTLDFVHASGEIASSGLRTDGLASLLSSVEIPWRFAVSNILSEEISVGSLNGQGLWSSPALGITGFEARLYGGALSGSAALDFQSGNGQGTFQGDFDYQKVARLLDRPVQRWMEQFSWETPPRVQAELAFQLPSLTNSLEQIERGLIDSLGISGGFEGAGSFAKIPVDHAQSQFHFTNFVWRLPDLTIERPEGTSRFDYTGDVLHGDFSCELDLRLDPAALQAVLPKESEKAFELVGFPEAPMLAGLAKGNWNRKEEIAFRGSFAASNFVARGIPILDVGGEMFYSNQVLEAWNVSAHMGTGAVRAPYLRMDFPAEVMFVTNAVSTVNPYDAMHIVGPVTYRAIDPYRFAQPPAVVVNGYVPLRHEDKSDLWFDVAGHDFTFWRFRLPALTGTVHWRGSELWITNVDASFYRGRGKFDGYFYIQDGEDRADFNFTGSTTNSDLKLLVADIFGMTNQMEGNLTGALVITSADTANDQSWNGYGEATLSDGFLWDVPVFGVFTPVLDALVPGEGMSRVTSGSGHFQITNSVVHTRDLQVRTRAFRLNYEGSVDLEGQLNATVDAEIFRDAWIFGKAFSVVLWPVSKAFEARISGKTTAPKTELKHFPRFLFAPFRALTQPKTPKPPLRQEGAAGLGPEDPRPPSP